MRKEKRIKKNSTAYIFVLIAIFAISMAASYFLLKGKFTFESSFINEIESRQANSTQKEQIKETPRLYERSGTNSSDSEGTGNDVISSLENAVREYLKPYKVRLLDLYMDREGIVYIDFDSELKKNYKGDASDEISFFAGLYKSIAPLVPGFSALKILIDGHEAETIGGHIDISKLLGKEIAENL